MRGGGGRLGREMERVVEGGGREGGEEKVERDEEEEKRMTQNRQKA